MNVQATASEFLAGLFEQVDAIDDEVEFGYRALLAEIFGEVMDVVVGQRSLAASLGMPDDAFASALFDRRLDGLSGEDLGVAPTMVRAR